jgi:competence protein ComEC
VAGISPWALAVSTIALALTRPHARTAAVAWLALVALAGAGGGALTGAARLRAIDAGAYSAPSGDRVTVRGFVTAVPRRNDGLVRVRLDTAAGRLEVEAREPVPDLPVGDEVSAAGTLAAPPAWLEGHLRRHGVTRILRAPRIVLTGARRGGIEGRIDRIRTRAEDALGKGMPAEQAALARGFVLGQDDRIPPATIEDFRRSGLAHLLAVSGQNVVLLALLAAPILAALGIPLRARLAWLLVLIALYVPLAGGGPSIQRAGAMGAAAVVATLAGRPASRIYALLLAAVATLALNPRSGSDVGWQLSFAAVVGIIVLVAPLRALVVDRIGDRGWRGGLADGIAVTTAATLATAPLMAHHFETVSTTSLAANLLALPAVAPAMWLGMLVAALGQAPWLPVEPLNWLNSILLAYIGQIAEWMAAPRWALVGLRLPGWTGVLSAWALGLIASLALYRWAKGRRGLRTAVGRRRALRLGLAGLAGLGLVALRGGGEPAAPAAPTAGMRVSALDVGQGDSILFQPGNGPPLLVDGGPPENDLREDLSALGVDALGAVIVTHDQSDHVGGLGQLWDGVPVGRLVYAAGPPRLLDAARAAGASPVQVGEGATLRSGSLRLDVLWPPRELLDAPEAEDPNTRSLVLLARWRRFEMLLTGDAEAESVPIDPGSVDVLKVSHHGSADTGLDRLLDHSRPRLAVISVGERNPFGHPHPDTLDALTSHGVRVLRTDQLGAVTIEVGKRGSAVALLP